MPEIHVITGGAGFIGSHLAQMLLSRGREVRIVDDFSTGKEENVPPDARLIRGDVNESAREAVEGADVVYHLAAQVSVPRSMEDPLGSHRATALSTLSLLEAAERAGVRRLVLASSSAVYGDRPPLPKREEHPPAPASPYAAAKLCSEVYARYWAARGTTQTVSLRFFNVYGPRQDPASPYAAAIPIFVRCLLEDRPVPIFGDGRQTRDFVYVEDVVRGLISAATAPDAVGKVYNLAGGRGITVLELVETLAELAGVRARLEFRPPRAGDVRHSWADISEAARDLRFDPRTDLPHGLQRTLNWYKGVSGGGPKVVAA